MPSVLIVEKDISKSVQILNTINNPNLRCSGIINDITDIDSKCSIKRRIENLKQILYN